MIVTPRVSNISRSEVTVPPLRSCLYECRVMHHRLSPKVHRFEYGGYWMSLDLDELEQLESRSWLFGYRHRGLFRFLDADHFPMHPPNIEAPGLENPDSRLSLKQALTRWLSGQGVALPADVRVTLLTLPRVMGYVFNPVSFYFCSERQGVPICAVAEVGNTFGELKPYLIPAIDKGSDRFRRVVPKHFYVSPFMEIDVDFDFKLRRPGERLEIAVNDLVGGQEQLVTTLVGQRFPWSDRQLFRLSLKYPLVTLRVIFLIHWQAFRLWIKQVPWFGKAERIESQTGRFRPHSTLEKSSVASPAVAKSG